MKLACSSAVYERHMRDGSLDLREFLRIAANDLEVDGVEFLASHFPTTDHLYLRDLKRMCVDLHLSVAGLAVNNDFGSRQARAVDADRIRQWCEVAVYLGAPVIRVFAGHVPSRPPDEHDPGRIVSAFRAVFGQRPAVDGRRLWSDVMWSLRQSADYAAERGITLVLQNESERGIVGTWQQLAQCVQDVGSPWLRVSLDPVAINESPRYDDVLRKTVQVRATLRDIDANGADRAAYWPELLRGLKAERYRGFIVMDYAGDTDPREVMPRASAYLRTAMHLVARQEMLAEALGENGSAPHDDIALEDAPPPSLTNEPPQNVDEARLLDVHRNQ